MNEPDRRLRIASELEETRIQFHSLLAEIPGDLWRSESGHSHWPISAVMFHMTVALQFLPEDLWMIRNLGTVPAPPAFLFHTLNDLYTRWGGRKKASRIAELYDSRHNRVIDLLETIRQDEWDKGAHYPGWDPELSGWVTVERLFLYPTIHFEVHSPQVRAGL